MRRFPRLEERRRQFAGTLSGGEQQLLAFGRAMMSQPKLLMLDEPSLGLAPLMVAEVMRSIRVFRDSGVTVFLVEQNANLALRLADRAYVMETGNVTMSGSGAQLLADERVRASYLGAKATLARRRLGTLSERPRGCFADQGCSDIVTVRALRGRAIMTMNRRKFIGAGAGAAALAWSSPAAWAQSRGADQDRRLRADVGQCRGPGAEHTRIGRDGRQRSRIPPAACSAGRSSS